MPHRRSRALAAFPHKPPSEEPTNTLEDTDMDDVEDADCEDHNGTTNKRSSPHKAGRAQAEHAIELESEGEMAVSRRARKQSLKVRANQATHEEALAVSQGEMLTTLLQLNKEMNKRMIAMEKKEDTYRDQVQRLEKVHKDEVKRLEELVETMQLDIASLKSASPYWAMSLSSGNQSSSQQEGSSPRTSLQTSPPGSIGTTLRSALRTTASERGPRGTLLTVDLKPLDEEIASEYNTTVKMRDRLETALHSIRGLQQLEVRDFKMRHTSDTVKVIRFLVSKPKWYSLKVDWIEKTLAMDTGTSRMSEDAGQSFGQENGVEVCQMKWLRTPKPEAQHASAAVKVATKEDAEKLLRAALESRDVSADTSDILQGTARRDHDALSAETMATNGASPPT
ncbi:hypothetical protein B0A49_08190 [Cryomyces minteri]|uniref:Uncharacterized protein n=1 Tax=Cryomyces minteri TaxID=331657 RepID=A0A4U0XUX2_9PEZI|nr:hypothetical protein B0A49_08190 [Cryomyces minteri]